MRTAAAASVLAASLCLPTVVPAFASSWHSTAAAQHRGLHRGLHRAHALHRTTVAPHTTSSASGSTVSTTSTSPTRSASPTRSVSASASASSASSARSSASTSARASSSPSASAATSSSPRASTSSSPSPTTAVTPPQTTLTTSSLGLTEDQLVDSIGVNIHPNYLDATYVQGGTADVTLGALVKLGVTRVRMGLQKSPPKYMGSFLDGLRANGIKAVGLAGTPAGYWDTYRTGESAQLRNAVLNGVYRNRLSMLELPNEWDHNGGSSWESALRTYDSEYYRTLRGTGLPVLGPSMAHTPGYGVLGQSTDGDTANIHPYAGTDIPEASAVLPRWISASAKTMTGRPVLATELGWTNATNASQGVSEAKSAAYLLRSLIWNRTHGVDQNYVYELFDEKPEPALSNREQHFGLVAVTGDPGKRSTWVQREKPAYTQLRNLLLRLQDDGTASPVKVHYTIANAPDDVTAVPLLRSDGSMDLAIWRKIPLDGQAHTGSTSVTVRFDGTKSVSAYDSVTGQTRRVAASATSVPVDVSGAVTILRVADPQ